MQTQTVTHEHELSSLKLFGRTTTQSSHSTNQATMNQINLNAGWIALGNRTHPNLRLVDELRKTTTYDGRESDIDELERAHLEGSSYTFEMLKFKISERAEDAWW